MLYMAWPTEQIVAEVVCLTVEIIKLIIECTFLYQHWLNGIDGIWWTSLVFCVVAVVIEFIHLCLIYKHRVDHLFMNNVANIKRCSVVLTVVQILVSLYQGSSSNMGNVTLPGSTTQSTDFENAVSYYAYCIGFKVIIHCIYECCVSHGCQSEEKSTPRKRV